MYRSSAVSFKKNIHTFVLLSENEPKTYTFAMKQSKIRIKDMILLNTKVLLCSMSPLKNKYYIKWTYDSWNRIKDIKYPDGELVSYEYNSAGQLTSMEGLKLGANYAYVNDIEYDKFGSRSSIEYGNGTKTEYTYDAITRRLSKLRSFNSSNTLMQDISYTYNNIGNISSQANSANDINGLGGAYTYNYTYDDISRLTSSSGDFGETADFVLNMTYSASGNITSKDLTATTVLNGISTSIDYNNDYNYNTSQPHTINRISDNAVTTHEITWDENGNMTYLNKGTTLTRCMSWDEENRLTAVKDNQTSFSHYIYNAGGERVWKLRGGIENMSINGSASINQCNLEKILYVNPYMVASEDNYTKHYYIESQRVTSKIGGGMMINPTIGIHDAIEPINGDTTDIGTNLFTNLTQSSCSDMVFNIGTSIYSIDEALQMDEPEVIQFFYHSDHLGSSSFITDASGDVDQFIQYMPFGELLVDQRSSGHDIRYKFTGKERDEETGLDYFGTRYYSSDISVWLSVDPLASMYPSVSPYMYVLGNPVMLKDPDGRWVKGAGFWRNIFKSDNRINAENRVSALKKQGIDASKSRNWKAGGWDVTYASNESWPADLDAKGSTLSSSTVENFSRQNRNNEVAEAVSYIDRAMDNGMRNLTKPLGNINTGVGSNIHTICKIIANINPLVSVTNAGKIFLGDGKDIMI